MYTVTEPLGYDATYTWSGSVVGHDGKAVPVKGELTTVAPTKVIDGGFQLADGQTVGDRGADHHPVRCADRRQGRRRAGAEGHHRAARRGQLGVAARRSRGRPRALAHPRVLPGRHQGQRRRQALRAGVRRRRLRQAGHEPELRHRSPPGGQGRSHVAPHPGGPRRGRHHGLPVQLRRSRQSPQRHAQRHPRGQREVLRLLHVQPGRRLQPHPRTLGGADLQQRRVHPRQPVQRRRAGQHQRHQRLHQPVDGRCRSSTSAARSTATRSR